MASATTLPPQVENARGLPASPRIPPLLITVAWAIAPTWVLDRCAASLGRTFTLKFFPSGRQMVVLSDPGDVKTVFTAPPQVAPSAAGTTPLAPVMGPSSVITLTGPEHMRQRKLLLPPFHGERMREYEQVIVQATRADMDTWPIGVPMRLAPHTRAITLEVILRAVFGVEADRMEQLRTAIGALIRPIGVLAMLRLAFRRPTLERPTGPIGDALDHLDQVIYAELDRRRAQSDLQERTDILSLLLQARDEQGESMTDQELRDELVTLLLAGHETTATAVSWAIERLIRHPDKLQRLVAEIDAGEEDRYMQAVIHETLRVRPVVPMVVRTLTQPLLVGGRELAPGTRVVPSIYLTNRNPDVYDAPEEFRPERFLDRSPDTFSWIPFGGGIRRCIGAAFAMLEMKLMLASILTELQPELPAGGGDRGTGEHMRRRAITLVPSRGTNVLFRRR